MSRRLSSEVNNEMSLNSPQQRKRQRMEKLDMLSQKSIVLNQEQAIFLDPLSSLSLVENIPNSEALSSEDLTKYLLRLCVDKDTNRVRICHKRGKSNQRKVWIISLGGAEFILDQSGRDGRAKTKLSIFRPGRIFVWESAGSLFFSVTGMIDGQPCFWVLCEAPNLNDLIRTRVFRNRTRALRFTLNLWREHFPEVSVKNGPQSNEVFLDNFESLFDLELGIHPCAQQAARNLRTQLEVSNYDNENRAQILEYFASKLGMKVEDVVALMYMEEENIKEEVPLAEEPSVKEPRTEDQQTKAQEEVENVSDDYEFLAFLLDSVPIPESVIASIEPMVPESVVANTQATVIREAAVEDESEATHLADSDEPRIEDQDATDRADLILEAPWTFEPFNLDEILEKAFD